MMPYSDRLIKSLDSLLKLDLLRYLVFARGKPVRPWQVADDLGYAVADVKRALRDFVSLGIAVPCRRDDSAVFALTASREVRHTIDEILNSWAGLQRTGSDPEEYSPAKEAA